MQPIRPSANDTVDRWLRRCAIGVTLGCIIVIAWSILVLRKPPPDEGAVFEIGRHVGMPPVFYENAALTALVFVRSTCGACQESAPFLRDFLAAAGRRGIGLTTVTLANDLGAPAYATRIGSERGQVVSLSLEQYLALPVNSVPAVVIVNRAGLVVMQFTGKPSDEAQRELIARVESVVP